MDPNLFRVDWPRLLEALVAIVVLALFIERALAILFENRHLLRLLQSRGLKDVLAFVVAAVISVKWRVDVVSMTLLDGRTSGFGQLLTAGIIAGSAKAWVKLLRDVFGIRSSAYEESRPPRVATTAISDPAGSTPRVSSPADPTLLVEYEQNCDFIRHQDRTYWVLVAALLVLLGTMFQLGRDLPGTERWLAACFVLVSLLFVAPMLFKYVKWTHKRAKRNVEIEKILRMNSFIETGVEPTKGVRLMIIGWSLFIVIVTLLWAAAPGFKAEDLGSREAPARDGR